MTPIQIILMTGIALLLLAVGVVVFLAAAAVWWEGKKIMSARDVVNQISTLQSALSAVRKDLQSTDEQLSAWMNRTAVRSRRGCGRWGRACNSGSIGRSGASRAGRA